MTTPSNKPDASPPRPRGWRRWFQFRLKSLMLLTLTVAGFMSWYTEPQLHETKLPGGWRQLSTGVDVGESNNAITLLGRHGQFELQNEQGKVVIFGKNRSDVVSDWQLFDLNGRLLQTGLTDPQGRRSTWRTFHANGRVAESITFDPPAPSLDGVTGEFNWRVLEQAEKHPAHRNGPAEAWWPNGKRRFAGQFKDDQPHGEWLYFNDQEIETARGVFAAGVRQGFWTLLDETTGETAKIFFARGRVVPDFQDRCRELETVVTSGAFGQRLAAVRELATFGFDAWPVLKKGLADRDERIIARTLQAIAALGPHPEPEQLSLPAWDSFKNPQIRFLAVAALAALDEKQRPDHLRRLLELTAAADVVDRVEMLLWFHELNLELVDVIAGELASTNPRLRETALRVLTMVCSNGDREDLLVSEFEAIDPPTSAATALRPSSLFHRVDCRRDCLARPNTDRFTAYEIVAAVLEKFLKKNADSPLAARVEIELNRIKNVYKDPFGW